VGNSKLEATLANELTGRPLVERDTCAMNDARRSYYRYWMMACTVNVPSIAGSTFSPTDRNEFLFHGWNVPRGSDKV